MLLTCGRSLVQGAVVSITLTALCLVMAEAGQPNKSYSIENIPSTDVGGVRYWDGNSWQTAKKETIKGFDKGGTYDCRDRSALNAWFATLKTIRERLESYDAWLKKAVIEAGTMIRDARQQYDDTFAHLPRPPDLPARRGEAVERWRDAVESRENIRAAMDDTTRRLKALEKQRSTKDEDVRRICGVPRCETYAECKARCPSCACAGTCR